MASLYGFDASQVPEQQEFTALPEGQYVVIATASEMKPTKNGNGEFLQFTFEVLDGPMKGRKVWARLNLKNPNGQHLPCRGGHQAERQRRTAQQAASCHGQGRDR